MNCKYVAAVLLSVCLVGAYFAIRHRMIWNLSLRTEPDFALCAFCSQPIPPSRADWPLHPQTETAQTPHASTSIEEAQAR